MTGYYLFPKAAIVDNGMNVKIEDAQTGAVVTVFENGIGGLAANMKNGHIYKVSIFNQNGGMGYYQSVGFGNLSQPYNYFSIEGMV